MAENRRKYPIFNENGLVFCKKSLKTADIHEYWDIKSCENIEQLLDAFLSFPDFALFIEGKFYKYIYTGKPRSFLIKTESTNWMPFNLAYFNRIFRKFV